MNLKPVRVRRSYQRQVENAGNKATRCDIIGSSDSSIRNVIPADIGRILSSSPISAVFANGATAHRLYQKYIFPATGFPAGKLPSTSPANAAFSIEKLQDNWNVILQYL